MQPSPRCVRCCGAWLRLAEVRPAQAGCAAQLNVHVCYPNRSGFYVSCLTHACKSNTRVQRLTSPIHSRTTVAPLYELMPHVLSSVGITPPPPAAPGTPVCDPVSSGCAGTPCCSTAPASGMGGRESNMCNSFKVARRCRVVAGQRCSLFAAPRLPAFHLAQPVLMTATKQLAFLQPPQRFNLLPGSAALPHPAKWSVAAADEVAPASAARRVPLPLSGALRPPPLMPAAPPPLPPAA